MRLLQREYRDLSFVPRWAIVRTIRDQNVAEHSFYVALYAEQFARQIKWVGDFGALLQYALYHDVAECFTSDLPGPIKRAGMDKEKWDTMEMSGVRERFGKDLVELLTNVDPQIKAIVKIANGFDELAFLRGEMQMGNGAVRDMYYATEIRYRGIIENSLHEIFGWELWEARKLWDNILEPSINSHELAQSKVPK